MFDKGEDPYGLYTASIPSKIYKSLPDIVLEIESDKPLIVPKEVYLESQIFGGYILTFEAFRTEDMKHYGTDDSV